jgi:hypothetical protein
MIYQICNFFYNSEIYPFWKEKINSNQNFNRLTWQNVVDFVSAYEQTTLLRNKILKTDNLKQFIEVATANGYSFTEEELAWVLITNKEIWDFFKSAEEIPEIKEQLLSSKNPQEFVKIATDNGYKFSVEALGWLLTDIKSSSSVGISDFVGEVITVPIIGRIGGILNWMAMAETWGIVPPFCHREQPNNSSILSTWNEDIYNKKYSLRKCFLPRCYFNQRLMSQLSN